MPISTPTTSGARSGSSGKPHAREQRRVERQHPEEDGGEPGRDVLLAPVHEPIRERERSEREHGGERPVGPQRSPLYRGDGEQNEAGRREPDPGAEQGRAVL